jgi:hypothetical protein
MIDTYNIYAAGIRKVPPRKATGGEFIPEVVKGILQVCHNCKSPIIPLRGSYFVGESVKCDNCGEAFTVAERFGFMELRLSNDISSAYRILRFLERLVRYRIGFNGSQVLYFDKETTAERYAEILSTCGEVRSWYGGRLYCGRLPEMDLKIEGVEMYAVSK